ncbi:chitinase [Streptomyces sp. TE33382]
MRSWWPRRVGRGPAVGVRVLDLPVRTAAVADRVDGRGRSVDRDPVQPGRFAAGARFDEIFPDRDPFYTYQGLIDALHAYPRFANTGTPATRAREAAAFLTHADFESVGLKYVKEINEANYWRKCDYNRPYGCPAGRKAYYGRGPIMFSWNFNYKAAGDALGLDLLNNPWLVEQDPSVAWQTALWYWNTQNGPGTMTSHEAMVGGAGFGETIRSLNGALECDGGNPASVAARVAAYERVTGIIGTAPGSGLTC